MDFKNDAAFAGQLDEKDPLRAFREKFLFPQHQGKKVMYFTGNSLGLQPVTVREIINQELDDWAKFGVEGHFHSRRPWFSYHEQFKKPLANLVGAKDFEVTAMNQLTTNLHLLLTTFYRPQGKRIKILFEEKAFPSDTYALTSRVRMHGYSANEALIKIAPSSGKEYIEEEDIYNAITANKDEIALVMLGGVNYYSGQRFDMATITDKAHQAGAFCGFDLAHAIGNVELELHNWNVDFAAWCSYKYLNSGPGSVSGIFIHEKFSEKKDIPRCEGWWGTDPNSRFLMGDEFIPAKGADAWQLSNAPVFAMAPHLASLQIFEEAGTKNLFVKRDMLTSYLEFIVEEIAKDFPDADIQIITPREIKRRGSQLSLTLEKRGKEMFDYLSANGVIADWREPNVIRIAPVPMYNSFSDIYNFGQILKNGLQQ